MSDSIECCGYEVGFTCQPRARKPSRRDVKFGKRDSVLVSGIFTSTPTYLLGKVHRRSTDTKKILLVRHIGSDNIQPSIKMTKNDFSIIRELP